MVPNRILLCGVLLGTCVAAATAQQADVVRKPTFLRVLGADGEPLAGATVTLAGGMPHLGVDLSPPDVVVVASDRRGRATAKLLPGLCYVTWAVGPADASGACARSPVVGYFGASALLDLRCDVVERPRRVRFTGAEAWADEGPLRCVAVTPYPGDDVELEVGSDGLLVVPVGPFSGIEVRTRSGRPLWSTGSSATAVDLPPPRSLAVRVVDERGAALPGASVRHRVARRTPWHLDGFDGVADSVFRDLGTTDAEGRAQVVVPCRGTPLQDPKDGDLLLFAGAPGRPAVAGGMFGGAYYRDDRRVAEPPAAELLFTCGPAEPLRGRIGAAPVGSVAHLAAVCKMFGDKTSYRHDARSFSAPIGPDGTFEFTEVPLELHSSRLTIVPGPGASRRLPLFPAFADRQLPPEVALLPAVPARLAATLPVASVRLRVAEPDGGPAGGTVVLLVPGDLRGVLMRDSLVRLPLDAAGSGTLSLLPGPWVVLAVSRAGFAAAKLDLAAGEQDRSLALEPLGRLRLRLLDDDGSPVQGAMLQARGSRTRASGDPVQALLQSYSANLRSQWSNLRTDADGRLEFTFVLVEGIQHRAGLAWGHRSTADFAVEPNDSVLELRPR
jgi:hypothetical protein